MSANDAAGWQTRCSNGLLQDGINPETEMNPTDVWYLQHDISLLAGCATVHLGDSGADDLEQALAIRNLLSITTNYFGLTRAVSSTAPAAE